MILIKGIASLGAAMLIGLSAPSAQAGYVVDLTQQGSNVVASGSGAIDLTGLFFLGSISLSSELDQRSGYTYRAGGSELSRRLRQLYWASEFRERTPDFCRYG
jgi:hypothetical protein